MAPPWRRDAVARRPPEAGGEGVESGARPCTRSTARAQRTQPSTGRGAACRAAYPPPSSRSEKEWSGSARWCDGLLFPRAARSATSSASTNSAHQRDSGPRAGQARALQARSRRCSPSGSRRRDNCTAPRSSCTPSAQRHAGGERGRASGSATDQSARRRPPRVRATSSTQIDCCTKLARAER